MKALTLTLIAAIAVLAGCAATYPPGSAQALAAEQHRTVMNECMSDHVDQIQEMSQIDPTYIYRKCRAYADSYLNRSAPPQVPAR